MTQEEKELLLKDLCSRLPYDVECEIRQREGCSPVLHDKLTYGTLRGIIEYGWFVQPYLRPMSSMTEREIQVYRSYCECNDCDFNGEVLYFDTIESFDYLNSIHLDYRGLIPKGLAIEVTEENNPYKE